MMDTIKRILAKEDWKYLVKHFLPVNFADALPFSQAMQLVGNLVEAAEEAMYKNSRLTDLFRDFAVNLMMILRAKHPKKWEKDWKNEAFLGLACAMVYREEEGFAYVKNAYESLTDPPQSLLLLLTGLAHQPEPHLSEKEIAELTVKAFEKGVTYESAERMAARFWREEEEKEYQHWKQKAAKAEANKQLTAIILPDVLKSMFPLEEGYHYEE